MPLYVAVILLTCLYSFTNSLRGNGDISRLEMAACCGSWMFLSAAYVEYGIVLGVITFFFLWAALSFGWGIGFSCVTGRRNINEKELFLLDKVARFFCKNDNSVTDNRKFGFIWLTLRGSFFYLVFTAYSGINYVYGQDMVKPLLYGLGCLSMGLVYWLSYYWPDESKRIRLSESVYGGILGLLSGLSTHQF